MIGGVQVGSYRVSCSVNGYRLQSVGPVEIEDASTEVEIDFSMQPGDSLRGRVVDDSGRGLGGVPVLASPTGQIDPWGMSASTAISDVKPRSTRHATMTQPLGCRRSQTDWPLIMLISYIGLILYFKSQGGYKAVELESSPQSE